MINDIKLVSLKLIEILFGGHYYNVFADSMQIVEVFLKI